MGLRWNADWSHLLPQNSKTQESKRKREKNSLRTLRSSPHQLPARFNDFSSLSPGVDFECDEKLAGNWLDLAEEKLIFQTRKNLADISERFFLLDGKSRFSGSSKSQVSRFEWSWKRFEISWTRVVFFIKFFLFLAIQIVIVWKFIPDFDYIMFYFSVSFLTSSGGFNRWNRPSARKQKSNTTFRFMTWKSKSCNHKHLWHLQKLIV